MSQFPARFNPLRNSTALSTRIDHTTVGTCIGGYVRYAGNSDGAADPQFVMGAGTSGATSIITAYLNYNANSNPVVDTTWGTGTTGIYTFVTADMTVAAFAALVNASKNWRFVASGLLPEQKMFVVGNGTSTAVTLNTAVTADSANAKACRTNSGTVIYLKLVATNNNAAICCGLESQDGSAFGDVLGRVSERTALIGVTKDLSDYTPYVGTTGTVGQKAVAITRLIATHASTDTPTVRIYACKRSGTSRLISTFLMGSAATAQVLFDYATDKWIVGLPGERLVVTVNDLITGSAEAATGVVLQADYGVGMPN